MLATRMRMGGTLLSDDLLPWLINVDVFMTAIANTNWSTTVADSTYLYNAYRISSGAQNAEVDFDVVLAAGTWTFEVIAQKDTNSGIISVQLDGVEVGTADLYNGSATYNNRLQVTSIAVTTTGKKRLKLKMATKNASSTGYDGIINHCQFKRTA